MLTQTSKSNLRAPFARRVDTRRQRLIGHGLRGLTKLAVQQMHACCACIAVLALLCLHCCACIAVLALLCFLFLRSSAVTWRTLQHLETRTGAHARFIYRWACANGTYASKAQSGDMVAAHTVAVEMDKACLTCCLLN